MGRYSGRSASAGDARPPPPSLFLRSPLMCFSRFSFNPYTPRRVPAWSAEHLIISFFLTCQRGAQRDVVISFALFGRASAAGGSVQILLASVFSGRGLEPECHLSAPALCPKARPRGAKRTRGA